MAVAREVIEKLIDDLDGGDAAETVTFGLDGATYEIDLSKKNAAAFRKSLARYVSAARRSSASARPARRKATPSTNGSKPKRGFDIVQLREWPAPTRSPCRRGADPELGGRAVQTSRRPLSSSRHPAP